MNYKDFCINLNKISSCKFITFLCKRINNDDYRGLQLSQHNRFDVNIVHLIIREIYNKFKFNLFVIRNTDLKKRPSNNLDETPYSELVDQINTKLVKRGITQDSLRKNFFVDFSRMNLIKRYDKNKVEINPYKKSPVKYVSLSNLGIKFAQLNDIFKINSLYYQCIDSLTNGIANDLLEIMIQIGLEKITLNDYQLFISYLNFKIDGRTITKTEICEYLKEFHKLSRFQRDAIVQIIKNYCSPLNFIGNKTKKRDFSNWRNEAEQIFTILDNSSFFKRDQKYNLVLTLDKKSIKNNHAQFKRSRTEMNKYFENHNVNKIKGFELHHIVPLLYANSLSEFNLLDSWQNMIYINAYIHSIISQNKNKNIKINFKNNDVYFEDPLGLNESIKCNHGEYRINSSNKTLIEKTNNDLLKSI